MKTSSPPATPARCTASVSTTPFYWGLTETARTELDSLLALKEFSRGATLFAEGQQARGAYLLRAGSVKLSTHSADGKALILRVAEPGEVIGLSSIISGRPHETTAQVADDGYVGFVKTPDFLNFIQTHQEAALSALRQLSNNYHKAHQQICSLGLSASVGDRLARLLLQWIDGPVDGGPITYSVRHTHSEIGEMIGTSRETVTRLLTDFKDRGLITLSRAELCIPDRDRLEASIGLQHRHP